MKIDSFYGFPRIAGSNQETARPETNRSIPGLSPQSDSFEINQPLWPVLNSNTNTRAFNATQYYGAARSLSTLGPQAESNDDAWRDYLGGGTLLRDIRHSRWVTDLFQGFNLRKTPPLENVLSKIPTPGGSLPILVPKPALIGVADVATPAGKITIATVGEATPLSKAAAEAGSLAKTGSLAKAASKVGRGLGRAVPFVNAGLAALDVHDAVKIAQDPKASPGKKVLGGVTAALSVASVVPGVGLIAGLGATLFGFIRDAVK